MGHVGPVKIEGPLKGKPEHTTTTVVKKIVKERHIVGHAPHIHPAPTHVVVGEVIKTVVSRNPPSLGGAKKRIVVRLGGAKRRIIRRKCLPGKKGENIADLNAL